jgi:hypothetical protein
MHPTAVQAKVVRDVLAVKLLLRRSKPNVLLIDLDPSEHLTWCKQIQSEFRGHLGDAKWYGMTQQANPGVDGLQLDGVLSWERFDDDLRAALGLESGAPSSARSKPELADCV